MTTIRCFLPLLLLSFFTSVTAQNCGCDHTLTNLNGSGVNIIHASSFNYAPGDVFCIQADTVRGLRFIGFEGTAADPLIFKNCGGKVVVIESTYSGITFRESEYIHFTGTGDPNIEYGIEVAQTGTGSMGFDVGYLSSDVEVDHLDIHDTGFAGIMGKTDPSCNDPLTWRRNGYILRNLHIHHNYIHETEGEGMYIGYTGGYKFQSNKICNGDTVFGHWLENVDIHDNVLENTGWDGIQVSLARSGARIYNNSIHNAGAANQTFQNFAMSIGGGEYEIFNNFMYNDPGMPGKGPQIISAQSGTKVYNNVFLDLKGYGLFVHPRHRLDDPNEGFYFLNNTFVRPELSCIMYNATITLDEDPALVGTRQETVPCYWHNNLMIQPGADHASGNTWKDEQESFIDFNNKSTRDSLAGYISSNLLTRRMDTLGLADTLNLDFSPASAASGAVDAGIDLGAYGVLTDLNGQARPQGLAYDVGAYEWSAPLGLQMVHQNIAFFPNPSRGKLTIKADGDLVNVRVRGIDGQKHPVRWSGREIDLGAIAPGLYFLDWELEGQIRGLSRIVRH